MSRLYAQFSVAEHWYTPSLQHPDMVGSPAQRIAPMFVLRRCRCTSAGSIHNATVTPYN